MSLMNFRGEFQPGFGLQGKRNNHYTTPRGEPRAVTGVITYRAKLLNADWLRQRAFFLNFPSMEGKITRS